jgi:hypothetical protein
MSVSPADLGGHHFFTVLTSYALGVSQSHAPVDLCPAGHPGFRIVNLEDDRAEVYTNPTGPSSQPDYWQQQGYLTNDSVAVVIGEQVIAWLVVGDILPRQVERLTALRLGL